MDGGMRGRDDGGRQRRVVALLLALAALAERAACRAAPVRWLVLWCLWQADLVARDHVRSAFSAAARPVRIEPPAAFTPRDGIALARSLRRLALVVRAMAARMSSTDEGEPALRFAGRAPARGAALGRAGRIGVPAQTGRTPFLWRLPTGPPSVSLR